MAFDSSSTLLASGELQGARAYCSMPHWGTLVLFLAVGSTDSSIKVWDATKHYCTHNLRGSGGVVTLVLFHPSRLHLITTSTDNSIRVWDLNTSKYVRPTTHYPRLEVVMPSQVAKSGMDVHAAGGVQLENNLQFLHI